MPPKDLWDCAPHACSKSRCENMCPTGAQSKGPWLPEFYLAKKWFMVLNIPTAFLISKKTSQNRKYLLIPDPSLGGGLGIGFLRNASTLCSPACAHRGEVAELRSRPSPASKYNRKTRDPELMTSFCRDSTLVSFPPKFWNSYVFPEYTDLASSRDFFLIFIQSATQMGTSCKSFWVRFQPSHTGPFYSEKFTHFLLTLLASHRPHK